MGMKHVVAAALMLLPSVAAAQVTQPPPSFEEDQDNTRYGGTSAVFLTLPADARGAALSGTISSLVSDLSAVFYNPAGLPMMNTGAQASFSYMPYIADTRHLSGAIGWSLRGGELAIGASIVNFGFSDQPIYTEDNQDGTGETYDVSATAVGLTGAIRFSDKFSAGLTARFVTESLGRTTAFGVVGDFGTMYQAEVGGRPLRAAFTITNLGQSFRHSGSQLNTDVDPIEDGQGVEDQPGELRSSPFEPPTQFRFSLAYDVVGGANNRLTLASEFFQPNDTDPGVSGAAEFAVNLNEGLTAALRGSYTLMSDNDIDGVASGDNEGLDGLSLGAGLGWRMASFNVNLDYAFRHMGVLSTVNMFSVKLGW
jgi:opacity protein-like surface antigen